MIGILKSCLSSCIFHNFNYNTGKLNSFYHPINNVLFNCYCEWSWEVSFGLWRNVFGNQIYLVCPSVFNHLLYLDKSFNYVQNCWRHTRMKPDNIILAICTRYIYIECSVYTQGTVGCVWWQRKQKQAEPLPSGASHLLEETHSQIIRHASVW